MIEKELQKKAKEEMDKRGMVYWFPPFPANKTAIRDIWGIFDFVAIQAGGISLSSKLIYRPIFVQITTKSNASKRIAKIKDFMNTNKVIIPNAYVWAYDLRVGEFVERAVYL